MEFKSDQHIDSFFSYSPSSSSSASQSNPNSPSSPPPPPPSSQKRKGGRKKFKETRHPVYRGVRQRNGNRWVCEIRVPNKKSRIWLGTYPTPEMAAVAHDVAALALRREMTVLNFPESAWRIPQARSCSAKDICIAAQEAAKAFQPSVTSCSSSSSARVQEEMVLEAVSSVEEVGFWDEEAFFNMPGLVDSLAEGLLLTPPAMERGFSWNDDVDSSRFDHFSLWSN